MGLDATKPCSLQMARRTAAKLSAKVGRCLWYQAAVAACTRRRPSRRDASRATTENRPSRHGVVRAMAFSDHGRWLEAVLPTDAEVVSHLSEGDLELPALDEPMDDP